MMPCACARVLVFAWAEAWGGPAAAFDLAAGFCVMGAILISAPWPSPTASLKPTQDGWLTFSQAYRHGKRKVQR